ncbi:hypothetical protein ABPG72_010994 [Tetrahymena utriculariae]
MSQDAKRKKDKVRFEEENVWMSLEDFQKGKAKDLHDVKNLRIEQDFNLSKPESMKYFKGNKLVMPLEGYLEEHEIQAESTRKLKNLEELQRIQFKKVIDGLDLWNNELKNKKRKEAMGQQQQICLEYPEFQSQSKKKQQQDPEIDMRLINSIVNVPEEDINKPLIRIDYNINQKQVDKYHEKQDLKIKSIDLIDDDHVSEKTIKLKEQKENEKRNSIIMCFPKSLSQIPTRPVTLTSLKIKNINDFKHKTVSRYIIDQDNKVVMKTDAQLQAEQNNQIINQIFKNKLSRVVESEKPQSKKDYQEIVNNQTALFKNETLAHFKSLHYLNNSENGTIINSLRDPGHRKYGTIEYKKLYSELFEDKLIKKNIKLEKEKQQLAQQRNYLDEKEKNLFTAYQNHLQNYRSNKETLNKLRVLLNINSQKRKAKNEEIKIVAEEYGNLIKQMESENVNSLLNQIEGKKNKRATLMAAVNPFNDQIEILQEKKLDALSDIKMQVTELDEELKQIQEEVEQAQKDYQNAKEKKNEVKFLIKQHFLQQLSKEINEKNPKSLVWIVVKLLNIKEQITYNIFPDYLEEKNIQFLIQMANLEIQKNEKQALMKSVNSQRFHNLQLSYQQKMMQFQSTGKKQRNNSSITAFSSQTSINPSLNTGVESTNKLSFVKKPVLVFDNNINENQVIFQIDGQQNYISEQTLSQQQIDNQLKEIKLAEEQYKNLLQQIEETKQSEFERLCTKYLKLKKDCKNIFYAIFGFNEGEKLLYEFERRKVKIEHLIDSNKTFQFSKAVGPQANIIANNNLLNAQTSVSSKLSLMESPVNNNNISVQGSISPRKLSTPDTSSLPYQLTNRYMPVQNRSNSNSLTEKVLDPIKNNKLQLSLRQSALDQFKRSVEYQVANQLQDAFQLFSPRIAPSIKKKIFEMSQKSENGSASASMASPRSPNSNFAKQFQSFTSGNQEKKKVGFYNTIKDQISDQKNNTSLGINIKKSFSQYQNIQLTKQKAPFLSNFFTKEDKTPLTNLQSPISSEIQSFSFSSPLISDAKVLQFTESDFSRNSYSQTNAKLAVKIRNFLDDKNNFKKDE